jgi:hypothetical protein
MARSRPVRKAKPVPVRDESTSESDEDGGSPPTVSDHVRIAENMLNTVRGLLEFAEVPELMSIIA